MKEYIRRHNFYIDERIEHIADFFHSLDESNRHIHIASLIAFLTDKTITSDSSITEPASQLKEMLKRWNIEEDGDLLGYIYTQVQNKSSLNGKGQYFTPPAIVDIIVDTTITHPNYQNIRILDPACGSGQFLISAFRRLLSFHLADGRSAEEASSHIIGNNLFGADTDQTALEICRYNLRSIAGLRSTAVLNLINTDTLQKGSLYFAEAFGSTPFDYIIGNPPWGSKISADQKRYYRREYSAAASGINTFTLFIERSLELLRTGGKLGFLIPEAYLNIKAHQQSRKDILSYTKIEEISLWGEQFKNVFAPSISLILEKDDSDQRDSHTIRIIGKQEREKNTCRLVSQKQFGKMHHSIFNINYSGKSEFLLESMASTDCIYLENNARFFLGIVTGNNEKHIFDHCADEHPDPIITGKDLLPYRIKDTKRYFKFSPEELQQTAPEELYRTKHKFMYRFIGSRLTFALDDKGLFSLNNVNGFIPTGLFMNDESMLSLLNSSLIQYYYHNSFFTVKVLKGNLEKLPLRLMSKDSQTRISGIVSEMKELTDTDRLSRSMENLDDIIFHEYGINDRHAAAIYSEFNPTQLTESLIN